MDVPDILRDTKLIADKTIVPRIQKAVVPGEVLNEARVGRSTHDV